MEHPSDFFTSEFAAKIFEGLAHPRRMKLLRLLAKHRRPLTFGELQTLMSCSSRVLSHHLRKMEAGTLIERREKGKYTFFTLTPAKTRHLFDRMEPFLN